MVYKIHVSVQTANTSDVIKDLMETLSVTAHSLMWPVIPVACKIGVSWVRVGNRTLRIGICDCKVPRLFGFDD